MLLRRLLKKKNKEPPLVITSRPVPVKEIWEKRSYQKSAFSSLFIHGLILMLLLVVFRKQVGDASEGVISLILPDHMIYFPTPVVKSGKSGGGGGGDRSPLPPSKGKLPKFAREQFTPPTPKILNEQPKLAMDPTLLIPPDIKLPSANMPVYGDPLAGIGPPSAGPGSGSGIGTGAGGGVGPGTGPGVGPGSGGGIGGGAYKIGGGVSAPQVIYKINPDYSEEARKARHQGMVELYIEVKEDGTVDPESIKVRRSLGLGLDEKAIEAIKRWRFKPGLKDGKPITVGVYISINFRLL